MSFAQLPTANPVAPARPAARRRLAWALAASALLHLAALALCGRFPVFPVPLMQRLPAFLVSLRAAASAAAPLPGDEPQAAQQVPSDRAAAEPAPAGGDPPSLAAREAAAALAAATRETRIVKLGASRLAAYLPPYLAAPSDNEAPTGPWYFARSQLTLAPAFISEPLLHVPQEAGGPNRGQVVLRIYVGANGAVEGIIVASSNLPPIYAEASVAGFAGVHFRPGEIEGVAVTSEAWVEVDFDAGDTGASHVSDRDPGLGAGR